MHLHLIGLLSCVKICFIVAVVSFPDVNLPHRYLVNLTF